MAGGGKEVTDARPGVSLKPCLVPTLPSPELPRRGPPWGDCPRGWAHHTSHPVPLQRASLREVPVRGREDAVRALPAGVAPPEVGVTVGGAEAGSG